MTWKLQAITGELEGQEVTIDRDMLVGRHQDADLLLQAAEISRRHAAFLLKEDALWVQDLKSSNGTFVNDIRIDQDKLLMDGDIVQFASVKFNVLAPVKPVVLQTEQAAPEVEVQPVVAPAGTPVQQPAEAVATAEIKPVAPVERTVADQMNEQGMPELSERDSSVQINREGMPSGVAIPKPAPIPEGVDIHAATQPKVEQVKAPELVAEEHVETQKNAKLGLATLVILIILAIIAWLLFK
ncbi:MULTISPECIES: FHA domain-containing protein [Acinetobacter]|uniref:FHA domain-containing protein n=1 Tax=Acinetobacter TaxID=469 RepID=UPI00141BB528|nr:MULTISPECIES: FHA domain-containing protein [Acinetobacter]MCS4298950.1 pSer/pThr/pTyr-binding forkhead associated (FHA) protein [Acinetobacter guillouiae]MCW2252312.1 pSer/pThr/pTyr-binding forkhead associated (FHA) protein [Acinetobacter sp. BIGb0204]NII38101.1 pSer/pThr/pTyr-binding forkhead associated (FHA) protein [Acinetobacter sp. BIGb0196]